MVLKCKSFSCVELLCCFCGSVFLLSILLSVLYMIYGQKWTSGLNDLNNNPDNFGIRNSLQSKVRSINSKKVMVMTENGLSETHDKINNFMDYRNEEDAGSTQVFL